jgi:hypothetical protein
MIKDSGHFAPALSSRHVQARETRSPGLKTTNACLPGICGESRQDLGAPFQSKRPGFSKAKTAETKEESLIYVGCLSVFATP